MPTVGSRIKRRRETLGWTQDELAKKANISKSFLSDLENGKRNVGADKLLDIARARGFDATVLSELLPAAELGMLEALKSQRPD